MDYVFHIIAKKSFVMQGCKFIPLFSSERDMVLGFTFRSFIYFELIVVYNARYILYRFLCLFNCSSTIF